MPSLRALEEFKASFHSLGSEPQTLRELNLPKDDLPLPDSEPQANPAYEEITASAAAVDDSPDASVPGEDLFGDLNDLLGVPGDFPSPEIFGETPADIPADIPTDIPTDIPMEFPTGFPDEPSPPGIEDFDFGSFGDIIPDSSAPDAPPDIEGPPPGLLDGFADELEAATDGTEAATEEAVEGETGEGGFDLGDFDFSGMNQGSQDLSEQNLEGLGPEGETPFDFGPDAFPDFDSGEILELPGEEGTEGIGTVKEAAAREAHAVQGGGFEGADLMAPEPLEAEFPEVEFPEEAELLEEAEPVDDASADASAGAGAEEPFSFPIPEEFGGLEDMGFEGGGLEDTGLEDTGTAGGDFDIPDLEPEELDPGTASGFDAFETPKLSEDEIDFGGDAAGFDSEAELEEIPQDAYDTFGQDSDDLAGGFDTGFDSGGGDDFGGMEDFAIPGLDFDEEPGGVAPAKTAGKERKAFAGKAAKISDEVEEINLTAGELEQFLETLASYPLNLRIACEELIAEQAVAPEQMSRLVKLLVDGAPAGETAALAGKVLDRTIPVPKDYEKKTGAALEEEQASFAYIFVHNFLPVLRLFFMISIVLLSAGYLTWKYVYTPLRAEKIYKLGIERIDAGEYGRANERFLEAYNIHQKKQWFYTYARAFRDARQYTLAEGKYQELLYYTASNNKKRIPEKAAVLEYADMETNYIGDYQTADDIIRRNILDYFPVDREGLLALGDNSLAWGEYEPERLEDARESYARYMERYGRSDPLLERMLKYFIRTDNLEQVLALQSHFMASARRKISADALAEMGGYFLDKRFEVVRGVPNEYLEYIGGIREILLKAIQQDPMLPESYYHLARYYNYYENSDDERRTIQVAARVFEATNEGSPKRISYHIFTLQRYAEIQTESREFFPAEENLLKAVNLYQDGLSRRLLKNSPEFGRLYADLGDLEFFVKEGNMQSALDYYRLSELNGYSPPEIQYRMGAALYQLRQWGPALERIFASYREMSPNRRILYALGNVSYMRGNYFAAQGYYDRLLEILNDDRARSPLITPTDDEKQLELAERLMVAQNNLGVTLDALTERTGDSRYRSRAQGLYSDSERAWDVLTRNPDTMIRMRPSPDISAPGVNPAYLNVQNSLHPVAGFEPQFFLRIDRDILEPSHWEDLSPPGYRLSEGIYTGR